MLTRMSTHIEVPSEGEKITLREDGSLLVPDQPIIPFIEGDGVGRDTTPVMRKVVDAAVAKAYGGQRRIHWMEVYAGDKAVKRYGQGQRMPVETIQAVRDYLVSIKGPLVPRWGAVIVRSTSPCVRSWICTCV